MSKSTKNGMKLKIAFVVISILLVINVIATVYFYSLTTDFQNQISALNGETDDLQSQVSGLVNETDELQVQLQTLQNQTDALEEIVIKEWSLVGEYTLTPSKTEETFNVSGETWRFTWSFQFTFSGGTISTTDNIRIYDETGNLIDGFRLGDKINETGVYYVNQGNGNYTIKLLGISNPFTFSFTVESYN